MTSNSFTPTSREETQRKMDIQAEAARTHKPSQSYTLADRFEEHACNRPDTIFLIYKDEAISYDELNRRANKIAYAALASGLQKGNVVALMMDNRPEFIATYLGLSKLGVTVALINTHAKEQALAHALQTTNSQFLYAGSECLNQVYSIPDLAGKFPIFCISDEAYQQPLPAGIRDLAELVQKASDENPPRELRQGITAADNLFYVFTSGTTGLPKAACMSHMRWLNTGESNAAVLQASDKDVFYCFLPLYHGAAGMSLMSAAVAVGASVVLRRKFSTTEFWQEVRRNRVTICQYIGEVCRYLLTQPERTDDADNPLKKIIGAGLSQPVWDQFQKRFGIEQIFEGWGATEANCGMMNLDNRAGSCGRIPFKDRHNARLIRYDTELDEYLKDAHGHCVECEANEVGELIGMILNIPDSGAGRFEGYTDPEATEKKILRNVFSEGDAWYRSGDLLRRDEEDYYYFVDRVGDTFRWKSENVSTQEVANALGDYAIFESINVYGVKIPGQEGRAGMAAVVLTENAIFDPGDFFYYCKNRLPRYAIPLFLRISKQAELTTTYKLRKVDLQKQGYSTELVSEPLYVLDEQQNCYRSLTNNTLEQLNIRPFVADV